MRFNMKLEASDLDQNCIQNGDSVSINTRTNQYVTAARQFGSLSADATQVGATETFVLVNHTDGERCLKSGDTISLATMYNLYMTAEKYTDGASAYWPWMGPWQKFVVAF